MTHPSPTPIIWNETQHEKEEYVPLLPWPLGDLSGIFKAGPILSLHTESKFTGGFSHTHHDWTLAFHLADFSFIPISSLGPGGTLQILYPSPAEPDTRSNLHRPKSIFSSSEFLWHL